MNLPTYEQYIKDMSLADQIKFYFDVDLDNYLGNNNLYLEGRGHFGQYKLYN